MCNETNSEHLRARAARVFPIQPAPSKLLKKRSQWIPRQASSYPAIFLLASGLVRRFPLV